MNHQRFLKRTGKGILADVLEDARKCACVCGTSLFLLILGIVIVSTRTVLFNFILDKGFTLQPGWPAYDVWIRNPIPLTLGIHPYNWTNPKDIFNASIKPKFQEIGPYLYSETKEKVNLVWNTNNTVSFMQLRKWYFEPSKSNGSLHDLITSVDPVALAAAHTVRDWSFFLKQTFNIFLRSVTAGVHSTHSVGQILFDGYDDPILNIRNILPALITLPPMEKFGWFYTRNGSAEYEGVFNMDVGISGQLGRLYSWDHRKDTSYFIGKCSHVGGSAGDFFPSNLNKDSVLKFFSPDLCRYLELEFEKEVVINGIVGYKYSARDRFLDNGTRVPENKCFCKDDCMPYGALDISACKYGSPTYISLPHFHKADPYYTNLIEGIKPEGDKHDFYMIMEPRTAIPLQVAARLQVNLLMQRIPAIRYYNSVPKIYFPVLWFEQVVTTPEDMTSLLKILLNFENICIGVGVFLILIAMIINVFWWYRICLIKRKNVNTEEVPLNSKTKC